MSAPYADRVAPDYPYPRAGRVDLGVLRDVLALALVLLGALAIIVPAFLVDWRLGAAALGAAMIAAGLYLGYER